jgi:hypothetical protein
VRARLRAHLIEHAFAATALGKICHVVVIACDHKRDRRPWLPREVAYRLAQEVPMTKWIVAAAMMITAAFATAPTASSPPPAEEVATGTCSYSCSSNGKTYINRQQCLANCSGVCTVEAC